MVQLSIITVCFNNKEGLIKTIDSVRKQIFKNYEFIVIDGGSIDGSFNVLEKNKDMFSYWVSEKDSGVYNAMNKGIKQATGQYCLFLNSGDYLLDENVLSKVFSFHYNDDILYGNILKTKGKQKRIIRYSKELTFLDFYKKEPGIHHQATFIKRDLFNLFGFYREDTYLIADWLFFFKVIVEKNVLTKYLNQIISVCDATGISNQKEKHIMTNPSVIKDLKLKNDMILNHISALVLKDYKIYYKKLSRFQKIRSIVKWKLSVLIPFSCYVRFTVLFR